MAIASVLYAVLFARDRRMACVPESGSSPIIQKSEKVALGSEWTKQDVHSPRLCVILARVHI